MSIKRVSPEECQNVKTWFPLDGTYKCIRKACDHSAQVWGGNCPCCFSRKMIEPYPIPTVITLCGSTRFRDEFFAEQARLTLEGNIVISVGLFGHLEFPEFMFEDAESNPTETKIMLDELHKRKIDQSSRIHVINKNGYIGSSTRGEIEYAEWYEKEITYMEPNV